jgi:hypothetical protein
MVQVLVDALDQEQQQFRLRNSEVNVQARRTAVIRTV